MRHVEQRASSTYSIHNTYTAQMHVDQATQIIIIHQIMQAWDALFTAALLSPGQMSDAHGALRSELSRGKTLHEALLKEVHTCCQHILGHTRRGGLTTDSAGGVHAQYVYIIT